MTYLGTNTYLLGTKELAVIDPGPDSPQHLEALLEAIGTAKVSHILLTHSHLDHSPLARPLANETGAPIFAFGPSAAGRSKIMRQLAADGFAGGGEGIDKSFQPDVMLADGEWLSAGDWELETLHTPGHIGNHLCFLWNDAVFTGDHVMGWASSLVSPPDGDLTDFMLSCEKLQKIQAMTFYPGHGAPVTGPAERLDWLINHRKMREAQIRGALIDQEHTAETLTAAIYTDIAKSMYPAATRNVFAHLVDLQQRGIVAASPHLALDAVFHLSGRG
jgi:glyoxylase-like metal-dependent hydrolase (beta-lactamase superfamily II)